MVQKSLAAVLLTMFFIFSSCTPTLIQDQKSLDTVKVTTDPSKTRLTSYEEFKKTEKSNASFSVTATGTQVFTGSGSSSFALIVNHTLYPQIEGSINRFISDVNAEGYTVVLHQIGNSGNPSELKQILINDKTTYSIEGAFFIGELPIAWFESIEVWYGYQVSYPTDYYYMDLDGNWQDTNANGIFDVHTNDYAADIWVGRLYAKNMTTTLTEAEMVNNYFNKNHAYRTGDLRLDDKSYTLINKDWKYSGFDASVSIAYPNNTILKDPDESVSAQAYRNAVFQASNKRYENILIAAHSGPTLHTFNTGSDYFNSTEIESNKVQANFYNLFACSSGRFIEQNCLANWYTLQSQYGLNTIGTTKTGSMLYFENYYNPLSQGKSMGNAFLSWFKSTVNTTDSSVSWYYGMVMIGDPTLKMSRFMTKKQGFSKNYEKVYLRGTSNNWTTSEMALTADNTWEITASFGSTANERFKFDIYGNWSLNFGDTDKNGIADQNGSDITVIGGKTYKIMFNDLTRSYSVVENSSTTTSTSSTSTSSTTSTSTSTSTTTTTIAYGFKKVWNQAYFRGTPNNWSTSALNLVADNTWEISFTAGSTSTERFKIDLNGDWSINYGDTDKNGILDQAGSDIILISGKSYKLTINDQTRAYTLSTSGAGKVSTYPQVYFRGTPNNWGSNAMTLISDYTWEITITAGNTTNERFKFDIYGNWSLNFGDNQNDGIADQSGNDILLSAGTTVKIQFNDLTKRYTKLVL